MTHVNTLFRVTSPAAVIGPTQKLEVALFVIWTKSLEVQKEPPTSARSVALK